MKSVSDERWVRGMNNNYAEIPWSVEETIENLKILRDSLGNRLLRENIDGRGKQDKEENDFDFNRAITALEAQQADMWIPISSGIVPETNDGDWAVFVIPGIFTTGSTRITARYFKGHGIKQEDGWTDKQVAKATHWMPLTTPWKEEQ